MNVKEFVKAEIMEGVGEAVLLLGVLILAFVYVFNFIGIGQNNNLFLIIGIIITAVGIYLIVVGTKKSLSALFRKK